MKACFKFVILLVFTCILSGCSGTALKERNYVIPDNYSGEALVKSYTDKTENEYTVKVACKDGRYNFVISNGTSDWNIDMDGGTCILSNGKFSDGNVTIDSYKIADSLIDEFNLSKFNRLQEKIPDELIYWDGTYKHVLTFSKENLLPKNIFIYKNDILVKTIEYKNLKLEA